jgi:hypothetical protein
VPSFGEVLYRSMSSGGPLWNATLRPSLDFGVAGVGLKRSGFASGRVERRAGAANSRQIRPLPYSEDYHLLPSLFN